MNNQKANKDVEVIEITLNRKNKNIIDINSFTFSYDSREDRLLFIVNYENIEQRIDFFVTRKMLFQLLDAFDNILINHCDNGKIFKEIYHNQEVLKTENIIKNKKNENKKQKQETPKTPAKWEKSINTKDLNFTKIKEPIILDALSFNISKDKKLNFRFISNDKIYASSTMDTIVFQRTISSLMRVIPFMSWGISPNVLD
jgi:hypothetical protein